MGEDFDRICIVWGSHFSASRGSQRAGWGPRAVVARGDAGRAPRDKKRSETQGTAYCGCRGQEVGQSVCQEGLWEHGGTTTRRVGCVMPGRRRASLVVQSIPRRQWARRGTPLPYRPFLGQRGGWISGSVAKPPGYNLTRQLLAMQRQRRAQRGGWIDRSVPKPPLYDLVQRIKRRHHR